MNDLDQETSTERRKRKAALRMTKLRATKAAKGLAAVTVTIPVARKAELAAIVAEWLADHSAE
jgi:hypothetical protein